MRPQELWTRSLTESRLQTVVVSRRRRHNRAFSFSHDLQDFLEWRDPDSNRGHHDFSHVQKPLGMRICRIGKRFSIQGVPLDTSWFCPYCCATVDTAFVIEEAYVRSPNSSLSGYSENRSFRPLGQYPAVENATGLRAIYSPRCRRSRSFRNSAIVASRTATTMRGAPIASLVAGGRGSSPLTCASVRIGVFRLISEHPPDRCQQPEDRFLYLSRRSGHSDLVPEVWHHHCQLPERRRSLLV
jgi:hypothetical protein